MDPLETTVRVITQTPLLSSDNAAIAALALMVVLLAGLVVVLLYALRQERAYSKELTDSLVKSTDAMQGLTATIHGVLSRL